MDYTEELKICERYYQKITAGIQTDKDELAIVRQLKEDAEKGAVPDDDGKSLVWLELDYDLPVDADFLVEGASARERLRRAWPLAAIVTGLLAIVFFIYGDQETTPAPEPTQTTAVSLVTSTLTPTAAPPSPTPPPTFTPPPTTTPLPTLTPTPPSPKEVEIKPEPIKLDADAVIPVSLEIAGRYFPIAPTTLRGDVWAYITDPTQVSWLAGSYVNIVLGLPYTGENLNLLAHTLTFSHTLTLRNNVGGTQTYHLTQRHTVGVYETEALNQRRVGLTLAVLGGNEESPDRRLILQAIPCGDDNDPCPIPPTPTPIRRKEVKPSGD